MSKKIYMTILFCLAFAVVSTTMTLYGNSTSQKGEIPMCIGMTLDELEDVLKENALSYTVKTAKSPGLSSIDQNGTLPNFVGKSYSGVKEYVNSNGYNIIPIIVRYP